MIFAQLSFEYKGTLKEREGFVMKILYEMQGCKLFFQSVSFRLNEMLVEVLLDTDPLDAPRHEIEAEEEISKELDKMDSDCSIHVCEGTDYIDEQEAYCPEMSKASQLRTGEA